MTPFQWITLPVLAVLFLTDVRLLLTRPTRRGFRLARALTWLAAGIAIFDPNLTTQAAHVIGIQRGADLVLYLFVLGTLAAAFSLYARSVRACAWSARLPSWPATSPSPKPAATRPCRRDDGRRSLSA
jgi:hypothetical protein